MRKIIAWLIALCLALSPVHAEALLPLLSGGISGAVLTYQTFATEGSGGSNITYSSLSFGAAASNRVMVVVIGARLTGSNNSVSSVTIGGVSATEAPSSLSQAAQVLTDIWYASVPSGATGNVNIVFAGATVATAVQIYSVNTSTPAPTSSSAGVSGVLTSISTTITVPTNGVGVVGFTDQGPSSPALTNATLDNNGAMTGGRALLSGHTTSTGSVSPGGTNASGTSLSLSAAAWGP